MAITGDKTLADIKAEESIIDKVQWAKDLSIKHKKSVLVAESFAPTTNADWDAVPTTKSAALDELASRVDDVEAESADVDELITLSGVAAGAENLGTFTGTTIPVDQTIKQALQALETEVELKADDDAVVHLTGAEVVESKSFETSCEFVDATDNTKALVINLSNQTTAVDVTLNSGAQAVATTVALPVINGSDTFVMAALAQVLESKALETSCEFVDATDNTKTAAFKLDTQSTGVDVVIDSGAQTVNTTVSLPVIGGADVLVVEGLAQTLESKSLETSCEIVDATDNTKTLAFDLSSQSAGVDVVIDAGAQTVNTTVSLPVISGPDTLVVAGVAQVLEAKSLESSCEFVDVADNTKVVDIALAGATTATETTLTFAQTVDRDVVFPDASGEVSLVETGASVKQIAKATITAADLNTAGTGVAAVAGPSIPVGAYVTRVYFDVTEVFAGDTADASTVSIGIEDQDDDIQTAASVQGAPFNGTGLEAGTGAIDGTLAKFFAITTAAKQISAKGTLVGTDTAFATGSVTVWAEFIV